MTDPGPVQVDVLEDGALWRVRLATPRANILDLEKILLLTSLFERAGTSRNLKAVLLAADGPNFSFGASVEEHLPGRFEEMIPAFGALFLEMLEAGVPCLAAVRGQCLGGGMELILLCSRIFAAPDARLGQPEIRLGVFPPVAAVVLPERVGRSAAEDLCLTGRIVAADEALSLGLVDALADDPDQAALEYARKHYLPLSASSLRLTLEAVRSGYARRFAAELHAVEELYLGSLMKSADAREGLTAFTEKRAPQWSNG